jgi:hypothetical protein
MTENVQAALLSLPMELERMGAKMSAGLAEFHNGSRLTAARYVDVSRRLVSTGSGRLVGWSVRNAHASAVLTVNVRNSRDASGDVVATLSLLAGEDSTVWLGPGGVDFGEALFLDVTGDGAGSLLGSVWLGAVD